MTNTRPPPITTPNISIIDDLAQFSSPQEDYLMNWSLDELSKFGQALMNKTLPMFIMAHIGDSNANPEKETNAEQFLRLIRNLSDDGKRILFEPNAGGNSIFSEVLSFEIMNRFFGATLEKTEMEIKYIPDGSQKIDYSINIAGEKVGVSVTRAFNFYDDSRFTAQDAQRLLTKKLKGLVTASNNVTSADRWTKQLLHIWVRNLDAARLIHDQYMKMPACLKSNTIVLVTIAPDYDCVFIERSGDLEDLSNRVSDCNYMQGVEHSDLICTPMLLTVAATNQR